MDFGEVWQLVVVVQRFGSLANIICHRRLVPPSQHHPRANRVFLDLPALQIHYR